MISSLRNVKRNSILGIHTEGRPEKGAEEQNVFSVFILGNLTFAFTLAPDAKTRMSNGSFRCFRVASCKYSVGTNTESWQNPHETYNVRLYSRRIFFVSHQILGLAL